MDHRIVTERASFFRNVARSELKGNWLKAVIAVAIYIVIIGIINFIVQMFDGGVTIQTISGIYDWLVYGPATVGIIAFFMNLVRKNQPKINNCFEGFERFGRSFILGVLMIIFMFLWTLLFVIPGIIASYRYSLAPMLLRDRPDLSPLECIRESKRLMTGNKGSKFCLDLSFIGWGLLASVPCGIFTTVLKVGALVDTISSQSILIISVICYIPLLWVLAYMQAANVVFYEEVIRPEFNKSGSQADDSYSYQKYEPQNDNQSDMNGNNGSEDDNQMN